VRRANAFHILSLLLASLGSAGWARAVDTRSDPVRFAAVALLLSAAGAAIAAVRVGRREREALVRHLRQAAAAVRPTDVRYAPAAVDADALGAAVDGVIAAARAQVATLDQRNRDLELQLKSATLERDHAVLERDHAQAAVAWAAGAAKVVARAADGPGVPPPVAPAGADPSAVAREVARMQRGFVALASHELRTPLASIKAYAEMLVDGEAADARSRHEFYAVVHAEACRLGQAVENVLTLARLEAGLLEPARRSTPLARVVERALAAVRPAADGKRLTLDVEPPPAAASTHAAAPYAAAVVVDEDLVALAVTNLLGNAVRATPDGGRVTVRTSVDRDRRVVGLTVRDGGTGISPKDLPSVFDRTYGGDEVGGRVGHAAGVGLTLARHVVEAVHGGRMLAESVPGAGSCFGFELRQDDGSVASDGPPRAGDEGPKAYAQVPVGEPTGK
jgi:signal transduction histidine kinase